VKILIIDPNPLDRKLARMILEAGNHEVMAVSSLEERDGLTDGWKADMVVTDVIVKSSEERIVFPIHLKENPAFSGIPVVAMTALAMKGDRERILSAGYDGYIAKPIRYQEFLSLIEEVSRISRIGGGV